MSRRLVRTSRLYSGRMDMKSITLEQIIRHPQPVTIPGYGLKLWVKPLTQIDRDLCQGSARRTSRELRKLLEDPKTEEHQLLIADEIAEYDAEALRALWVASRLVQKTLEARQESLENRDQTYTPEPEGELVSAKELDDYENEVEKVEEQREESLSKLISHQKEKLIAEARSLDDAALRVDALPDLIESVLTREWQQEFAVQMIVRGTYKDAKATKPAFKTAEEVRALQPDILEFLAQSHYGMMVDPEQLKASGDEAN